MFILFSFKAKSNASITELPELKTLFLIPLLARFCTADFVGAKCKVAIEKLFFYLLLQERRMNIICS